MNCSCFLFPPLLFLPLFRLSIFEAVFLCFRQCLVERTVPVRLPGVMIRGQAQGTVSLHQHVCVHLCGCVAVLPARHFPRLVSTVLRCSSYLLLVSRGVEKVHVVRTPYTLQVWIKLSFVSPSDAFSCCGYSLT